MRYQHHSLNSRHKYRGGWSTSIGGLLDDPHRKSNCCALTFCGVFLYDRTNYLVTGNRPNWSRRRITHLYIPFLLLVAIAVVSDDRVVLFLEAVFVAYLIFLCIFGGRKHGDLRQAVHQKKQEQERDENNLEEVSPLDISSIRKPVGCCSCYSYDVVVSVEDSGDTNPAEDSNERIASSADLSTRLFQAWSNACCGFLCQCWCQCCGMCAIGQEDRELTLILQKENNSEALHIDYITFQPYSEYFPMIRDIQNSRDGNHLSALSELSKKILRYAVYVIILTCGVFILSQDDHYGIKIAVALGVWVQPCLVLYFIWWKWNRFDISLDAIIKYFASGYVIGIFQAGLVEMIMLIPYSIFVVIGLANEVEKGSSTDFRTYLSDGKKIAQMMKDHWVLNVFFIFILAFFIVAIVEELVKYYCYWTIETPEQLDDTKKSKTSQANYITIGMVSAALGFACKENMQYVFSSQNARDEMIILLARSLLALHPVCAAIQSLGIVKRDVQGDPSSLLGRSLLPAIALHGMYDFVELVVSYYIEIDELEDPSAQDQASPDTSAGEILKQVGAGAIFMVLGLMYYFYHSRQQRKQLTLVDESEATATLEMNPIV